MNFNPETNLWIGPLVLTAVACVALGWWLARPEKVVETPAPAVQQADGSTVLERAPDAKARPAAEIPRGAKLERTVSVTVKPRAESNAGPKAGQGPGGSLMPAPDCPPVKVDLSLVRMPDRTRRVVASSPNGEIVGGLDVPVDTAPGSEPQRWAAGLSWSPIHHTAGVWVERDIGRVRLGADLQQARPLGLANTLTSTEVRLRVGLTF